MKSFSSLSFANDHAGALEGALAAVKGNPQALFTNFQWFLFEGKDTIFFTAFSKAPFDKEKLKTLAAQVVALAPQLTHGFNGAKPGYPLTESQLDQITSVELVDAFDGYPDKWLSRSADIFDQMDRPLFRFMAATRRGGPDAEGRASIIQVRAAHAVLEGSDSALLSRSQSAGHGVMSGDRAVDVRALIRSTMTGLISAGLHLLFAYLLSPPEKATHFKTLALPRQRIRLLASRLGLRQRSLYFALVTYALHSDSDRRHNEKLIAAAYTMLDTRRTAEDDDFFRVRALTAKFPYTPDFLAYARGVDKVVDEIETKDVTSFQMAMLAGFRMHRKLHAIMPWIYGKRFWRFSGATDTVLTLVPPHRTMGPVTEWMIEPIYCGAYHPAQNICTFCPGREFMTLNFVMEPRHIESVDKIEPLIARLEAMDLPAAGRAPVEVEEL